MDTINANEFNNNGLTKVDMNFIPKFKTIDKNSGVKDEYAISSPFEYMMMLGRKLITPTSLLK